MLFLFLAACRHDDDPAYAVSPREETALPSESDDQDETGPGTETGTETGTECGPNPTGLVVTQEEVAFVLGPHELLLAVGGQGFSLVDWNLQWDGPDEPVTVHVVWEDLDLGEILDDREIAAIPERVAPCGNELTTWTIAGDYFVSEACALDGHRARFTFEIGTFGEPVSSTMEFERIMRAMWLWDSKIGQYVSVCK